MRVPGRRRQKEHQSAKELLKLLRKHVLQSVENLNWWKNNLIWIRFNQNLFRIQPFVVNKKKHDYILIC